MGKRGGGYGGYGEGGGGYLLAHRQATVSLQEQHADTCI